MVQFATNVAKGRLIFKFSILLVAKDVSVVGRVKFARISLAQDLWLVENLSGNKSVYILLTDFKTIRLVKRLFQLD